MIGNRAEFFKKFGGYVTNADLAYAVSLFFQNGGTRCYVIRTSAHDSASGDELALAAGAIIEDGLGNDALLLEAASPGATGDSIPSPGAWGNSLAASIEHAWNPQETMDLTTPISVSITSNFNDLSFVNSSTGWAVGDAGVIATTNDGGNNWQQQRLNTATTFMPIATALNAVHFINPQSGWAVGDAGVIAATIPWTIQNSSLPTTIALNAIQFVDDRNGWAVGDSGTIIVTEDSGATWLQLTDTTTPSIPATALGTNNINSLQFLSESAGWVIGDGGLIVSWDGTAWSLDSDPGDVSNVVAQSNLNSLHMIDENTGWVVGASGAIAFLNIGTWESQTFIDTVTSLPITDDLNAVRFINATTGWAVGTNAEFYFTTVAHGFRKILQR